MWPLEVRLRVLRDTRGTSGVHTTLVQKLICRFFLFFAYRVERASGFCTISLWEHVFLTSSPFPRTLVQGLAAVSTAPRLERSSQGHRLSYSGAARVSQPQTDASRYLKEISGSRAPKAICRRQRHCNGPWYTTGSRRSHVPQPMQQVRSTRILCSSHAPTPCFI